MIISPNDYKFVPADPDPGFDEERNKRTVKEVMEATDRIAIRKRKELSEKTAERVDAVTRFFERVKSGLGASSPQSYFGQKMLDYLSGREERASDNLIVHDNLGNVVRGAGAATANVKK